MNTTSQPLIIAIDGPAASGKGTLAKRIAEHLELRYLDTGKLYRSVAYLMLEQGCDPKNIEGATKVAQTLDESNLVKKEMLYSEEIGVLASEISAYPEVREALLNYQRNYAKEGKGAVLDGRDIGTVICPDADVKFFITADLQARAERRTKELQNRGKCVIFTDILNDLQGRDERDSQRAIAPLVPAKDAIHIDTTNMNADSAFQKALTYLNGLG